MHYLKNEKGTALILELVLVALVLAVAGTGAYMALHHKPTPTVSKSTPTPSASCASSSPASSNPAVALAGSVEKYASSHCFTKAYSQQWDPQADSRLWIYHFAYTGKGDPVGLKDQLSALLNAQGFNLQQWQVQVSAACEQNQFSLECPDPQKDGNAINANQPYWVLEGRDRSRKGWLHIEITDHTYFVGSKPHQKATERAVPAGQAAIFGNFSESPTPAP